MIFSCPYIVSVPSKPPGDIKTTTSVSVIQVTWRHIPSYSVNGVLSGYKVFYRLSDDRGDEDNDAQYSEVTVRPTDLQAYIEGVINSENYEIRVAGFTAAGVGVFSDAVYARPGDSQFSLSNYCDLTFMFYKDYSMENASVRFLFAHAFRATLTQSFSDTPQRVNNFVQSIFPRCNLFIL